MCVIQIIICFLVIFSSGYGLIYNKIRNIKENKNSMWIYYTNLSNLFVLIYFVLLLASLFFSNFIFKNVIINSIFQYSLVMTITITLLIYHLMLKEKMKEKEKNSILFKIQNNCLHYITPVLVIIYWIIYSNKEGINYLSSVYWLIFPLIYLIAIMIRSNFIDIQNEKKKYPYHFIDKDILGDRKFYINVFIILFTFVALSEIIYMLIYLLR